MPADVFTLHALSGELHDALAGGRIDRISQPEKDEICLAIRAGGKNHLLVISANPNAPRIHLANGKKENPYAAPAFLMYLRKHLVGAIIQRIDIAGTDRIILIECCGRNELQDTVPLRLYIELMGRYSNIIVVDGEGFIGDCLRHIPPDEHQLRAVLPHLAYQLPPMAKASPTGEAVLGILAAYQGGNLVNHIITNVAGFATSTARELVYRAGMAEDIETLTPEESSRLAQQISNLYHAREQGYYQPCYTVKEGIPDDFFLFPYLHTGASFSPCASLTEAIRQTMEAKDKAQRLKNSGKQIASALKSSIKKHERGLSMAHQKLIECEGMEELRKKGELLTNNIYLLSRGMTEAKVYDYYADAEITIPLDIRLSPADNAQAYYKRYAKQKRTIAISEKQIQEHTQALDYLASIQAAFNLAEETAELVPLSEELQQAGYMRAPAKSSKVRKSAPLPMDTHIVDGFRVVRGKNNLQNEELTLRLSRDADMWFHVNSAHGCHVVVFTEGKQVPDSVMLYACRLAARYSDVCAEKVLVDYCPIRNVKRHPSHARGMVTYQATGSLLVNPKE